MTVTVVDTLSLLAFIASPALVAFLSTQAESWTWFQSISANGKLAIIGGVSVLLAMLALFLQNTLASNLSVLHAIDPYVAIALPIVNFIASQITHGTSTAKARGATSAVAAKAANPT